ncbi:MAG: hypothetical protein HQ559_13065, partial [Lentisphaerae bacterium]|nr:hypothetical protein [Lentisphaerota bacterium]
LGTVDKNLLNAAREADEAAEQSIGSKIRDTARDTRAVARSQTDQAGARAQSEKTETGLAGLAENITEHRASLEQAGTQFDNKASSAVANLVAPESGVRKNAERFFENTFRELIAEDYRKRAEELVSSVLKQKEMGAHEGFSKAVGQKAVDLLLENSGQSLAAGSFDRLTAASAAAYKSPPSPADGAAPSEAGMQSESPEAASSANAARASSADPALGDKVGEGMERSAEPAIRNALAGGRQALKLPALGSFGQQSGLSVRIQNAIANTGREARAGANERALIDLNRNLSRIGKAAKSNYRRAIAFRGRETDQAKYEKNVEEVVRGRTVDELVLNAPSVAAAKATAQGEMRKTRNALILAPRLDEDTGGDDKESAAQERTVYKPRFKTFSYGGAPLALEEPVIDGDLSEWKDVEEFALRGEVKKSYWPRPLPKEWENNRYLYIQWNPKGLYFAYRMVDDQDNIGAGAQDFWDNDSLELFFDFANKRSDTRTEETQQFWFWPVGSAMPADIIGGEAKPGSFEPRFRRGNSPSQPRMATRRVENPKGYHVELFLPVEVFDRPALRPGRIIAFDFSIHNGRQCYLYWTANLGKQISMTPSLWGDLVLLGSDAKVDFVLPGSDKELTVIVPGEPIGLRISDADMNLDAGSKDKIEAFFSAQNGDTVSGYLEETGESTGIFEGSIDTELLLLQDAGRVNDSVLQVAGGEIIEVTYLDQARRYGERNHETEASLAVGIPVLALSAKGK